MRNLKKLLAVIVAICILATLTVPAFAAGSFTYETQAKSLYDMKLFAGNSASEYVPALDGSLTREQGIILLVRLFGKDAEAKVFNDYTSLASYTDAAKITSWAKNYVAYAVKNGMVQGETLTTLNATGKLVGNAFATMILRNLGYTVDAAAYATAAATLQTKGGNLTADQAAAFASKDLIRDDAVGMMFNSLLAKDSENKIQIDKLIAAGVVTNDAAVAAGLVSKISAAVIDVNKIEVKFSKALDAVPTIALKKGLVPYTTTNTLSEDKKSVILTSSFNLPDGDYTVSVDGYEDQKVTVAAEKAVSLTIKSTSFQMLSATPISLALVNQYGKEMKLNRAEFTITAFNATKGTNIAVDAAKFELNASAAAKDDKIVISVLYKTGLNATATIPVINKASVSSFTFGNVVMPKDQTRVYEANTGVVIEYTMKDQYGNDITLPVSTATSGSAIYGVTFVSTNPDVVNVSTIATDAKGKLTFTAGKEGTTTITSLVAATGNTSAVVVTVEKKSAVKTFTMSAPAALIAAGEVIEIPYVAVDQFGAQIAAKDISATDIGKVKFASSNDSVITSANLKFGTANKLTLEAAGAGTATIYVYFNGVLQNSVPFTVNAKAVATRITGVKNLPAVFEANAAATANISFDNLTVVDQYNRPYTLKNETITVAAKDSSANVITFSNTTKSAIELTTGVSATFAGTANVGSEVFTIAVKDVLGSSIDYSMSTVATKDIVSYGLTLSSDKIYKTANVNYFATPKLTGKTSSGDVVNLVPGKVTHYTSNSPAVATVTPAAISTGKVQGVAVGTATITAWSGATALATATVAVSDAAPVATTVAIDNDPAITVVAGANLDMNALLSVKDQYGVNVKGNAAAYATGVWTTSDVTKATIDANGLLHGVAAGDVTIGFVTNNSIVTTVTVTVTAAPAQ